MAPGAINRVKDEEEGVCWYLAGLQKDQEGEVPICVVRGQIKSEPVSQRSVTLSIFLEQL